MTATAAGGAKVRPITIAVVAPSVPLSVTSSLAKSLTGSLNTTVKLIGDALVGSAWPPA